MKYCTYKTTHPSGFFYLGKGLTAKVEAGKYKGSGVRFKLALRQPGFEWDTWTTHVIQTFETETEAYFAEEALVPLDLLGNPFCLNSKAGGLRASYKTPARLLRQLESAEKLAARAAKRAAAAERKALLIAKTKELKARLKIAERGK